VCCVYLIKLEEAYGFKNSYRKINSLQGRIDSLKNKKVAISTEIDILQNQYNEKLSELKELGITDPSILPDKISELEKEIEDAIANADIIISDIESKLGS